MSVHKFARETVHRVLNVRSGLTILLLALALSSACGGGSSDRSESEEESIPVVEVPKLPERSEDLPVHRDSDPGFSGFDQLPDDRLLPGEELTSEGYVKRPVRDPESDHRRSTSYHEYTPNFAISNEGTSLQGPFRYASSEQIDVLQGAVLRFFPGENSPIGFGVYRLSMEDRNPAFISGDINTNPESSYWLAVANYSSREWEMRGPFQRNRFHLQLPRRPDYTSEFGNVFVAVLTSSPQGVDVLGIGADPQPSSLQDSFEPQFISAESTSGGVYLRWPAPPEDLQVAGFRIYYHSKPFQSKQEAFGSTGNPLLSGYDWVHRADADHKLYFRVAAVGLDGRESRLSEMDSAVPGDPPEADAAAPRLSSDQSVYPLDYPVKLEISGIEADEFSIDTDGDGRTEARVSSSSYSFTARHLRVYRPVVRALDAEGRVLAVMQQSLAASPSPGWFVHDPTGIGNTYRDNSSKLEQTPDGTLMFLSICDPDDNYENYICLHRSRTASTQPFSARDWDVDVLRDLGEDSNFRVRDLKLFPSGNLAVLFSLRNTLKVAVKPDFTSSSSGSWRVTSVHSIDEDTYVDFSDVRFVEGEDRLMFQYVWENSIAYIAGADTDAPALNRDWTTRKVISLPNHLASIDTVRTENSLLLFSSVLDGKLLVSKPQSPDEPVQKQWTTFEGELGWYSGGLLRAVTKSDRLVIGVRGSNRSVHLFSPRSLPVSPETEFRYLDTHRDASKFDLGFRPSGGFFLATLGESLDFHNLDPNSTLEDPSWTSQEVTPHARGGGVSVTFVQGGTPVLLAREAFAWGREMGQNRLQVGPIEGPSTLQEGDSGIFSVDAGGTGLMSFDWGPRDSWFESVAQPHRTRMTPEGISRTEEMSVELTVSAPGFIPETREKVVTVEDVLGHLDWKRKDFPEIETGSSSPQAFSVARPDGIPILALPSEQGLRILVKDDNPGSGEAWYSYFLTQREVEEVQFTELSGDRLILAYRVREQEETRIYYARATTPLPLSASDWEKHILTTDGDGISGRQLRVSEVSGHPVVAFRASQSVGSERAASASGPPSFYIPPLPAAIAVSHTESPSSQEDWEAHLIPPSSNAYRYDFLRPECLCLLEENPDGSLTAVLGGNLLGRLNNPFGDEPDWDFASSAGLEALDASFHEGRLYLVGEDGEDLVLASAPGRFPLRPDEWRHTVLTEGTEPRGGDLTILESDRAFIITENQLLYLFNITNEDPYQEDYSFDKYSEYESFDNDITIADTSGSKERLTISYFRDPGYDRDPHPAVMTVLDYF